MAEAALRVLMLTTEWPSPDCPASGVFIARQARSLEALGTDVDVYHVRRRLGMLKYPLGWIDARRDYDWSCYDIVHAQFGQSALIAWPFRHPVVVTFRGSDLLGISRGDRGYTLGGRLLQRFSRWTAARAAAVVVVSAELERLLPPGTAAHVIPSGIDRAIFRPQDRNTARSALGLPLQDYLVLFVGDPGVPVKRHSLARRSVDRLAAEFVHVPDGPGVRLITLTGLEPAAVATYMNACDVLLLTSRHEGSPNVVKEAIACNLPVVAVDVGDVRRRLVAVEGCAVVDSDDPEALAGELAQILRRHRRIDGRKAARELDERDLTLRLLEVYRSCARAASAPGAQNAKRSNAARNGWR